jgi:hypothetical protein
MWSEDSFHLQIKLASSWQILGIKRVAMIFFRIYVMLAKLPIHLKLCPVRNCEGSGVSFYLKFSLKKFQEF